MSEPQAAFNALLDLATRSRRAAKGLPSQADVQPHWSGVGFNLLNHFFVAPMGDITELLEMPVYTKLPGVQPWVLGVANVRGRLLPIFDLAAFFGGRLEGQRKRHRILVLESGDIYSGLVVDGALGMQHFPIDTYESHSEGLEEQLKPFVNGSYSQSKGAASEQDQKWYVFNPVQLIEDPRFISAAS
ncbi:MAG: chemotaxis protein CheW [Cellvibrionaceae bacterium]